MAGGEFDKDFGYLMPFLDKIARSAASIPDPAVRQELTALIGSEKTRWIRIRELLSSNPRIVASIANKSTGSAAKPNLSTQSSDAGVSYPQWQFTVGSLKGLKFKL